MMDSHLETITLLRSHGPRLAKLIRIDGSIECYDRARTFDIAETVVRDLDHVARILRRLAGRSDLCIVRGRPIRPESCRNVRRLVHADFAAGDSPTIEDAVRRWVALDIDSVAKPDDVPAADLLACARIVVPLLPEQFRTASAIVQATSGHGLKPGIRLRLWFWSDRPLSSAELTYWFRKFPVDAALFRPGQVIFTATPIFARGRVDHLPSRLAILPGEPLVVAPEPQALRPPPRPPAPPPHCNAVNRTAPNAC